MLTSGRLASSVILPETLQRQDVAAEIWGDLRPDFQKDSAFIPASGARQERSYGAVRIWEPASHRAHDELQNRMVAWMAKRHQEQGREKRLTLIELAEAEFGSSFRIQIFNVAFGEVYGHTRGRPKDASRKSKIEI
jgi:hypothetical protein